MRRRQVITLQVIVDVDFPVAFDHVVPPEGVPQFVDRAAEVGDLAGNRPHHVGQRRGVPVHIDEHIRSPDFGLPLGQADRCAVPIGDALEFGGAVQPAVQRVRPAVIRALDHRPGTLAGAQFRAAMAAHVGERAEDTVGRARHQHRLAGNLTGEPRSRPWRPSCQARRLPGAAEYAAPLGFQHFRAGVPTCRNCAGAGQIRLVCEITQNAP